MLFVAYLFAQREDVSRCEANKEGNKLSYPKMTAKLALKLRSYGIFNRFLVYVGRLLSVDCPIT